jgi:uncharacterized membrane protein YidH (DUF202 family)
MIDYRRFRVVLITGMNDKLSEIFGYILMASAVVLAVWETYAFRNRAEDAWLITRRRYRRRVLVSGVLILVGVLICVEARGVINIHRVAPLTIYVFTLTGLSLLLVVLALADFADTAQTARRHFMREVESSPEFPKVDSAPSPEQSNE